MLKLKEKGISHRKLSSTLPKPLNPKDVKKLSNGWIWAAVPMRRLSNCRRQWIQSGYVGISGIDQEYR